MAAFVANQDRMLHNGDLRCFGRGIPWCLDQTLPAGGHRRRGTPR